MSAARTWDQMTSRERDALVAETVMETPRHLIFGTNYELGSGADFDIVNYAPQYTTDISAAWEVAEKMRENGFWYFIGSGSKEHGKIVVEFRPQGEDGVAVVMDDVPEAICLAALRAKGVEV